jgi:Fe-S-cluster-containing dehydrogenase component
MQEKPLPLKNDLEELKREFDKGATELGIGGHKLWTETKPHGFVARFAGAEVFIREGWHSDWVFVLLAGSVRVYKPGARIEAYDPRSRQLSKWLWSAEELENSAGDKEKKADLPLIEAPPGDPGKAAGEKEKQSRTPSREEDLDLPRPLGRVACGEAHCEINSGADLAARVFDLAVALWNLPRPRTLAAGASGCTLLAIKRARFEMACAPFPAWQREGFWREELPEILRSNRLFHPGEPGAVDPKKLFEAYKEHVRLNRFSSKQQEREEFTYSSVPGLKKRKPAATGNDALLLFKKGAGALPRTLDLIVTGTVRVAQERPGGVIIVNQFGPGAFLEHSAWVAKDSYIATAEAITDANVVRLSGDLWGHLQENPLTFRRITDAREHARERLGAVEGARHIAPDGMTQEIASKLLLASDLLLIDTDICTRCDECVAGCAHGHAGTARFHRANPKLNFGKWEVAKACVHCPTAPCQAACADKGAITFLPDGLVHIHHDRCTGCMNCVPACPFEVIVMHAPDPGTRAAHLKGEALEDGVATKCDRCLTKDGDPPCVTSCPYGASRRGSPRQLFPLLGLWAEGPMAEPTGARR